MIIHTTTLSIALAFSAGSMIAAETAKVELGPDMIFARMAHNVARLPNGGLVVFGGHGSGFVALGTAEVWNPGAASFTQMPMQFAHDSAFFAKMADGRYLIGGGSSDWGVPSYATCEIFDPATLTFTVTGSMVRFRADAGSAALKGGKVLVAGAWWTHNDANAVGELFDPATGTFTATGSLNTPRSRPFVFPCDDGQAVVVGGFPPSGGTLAASPEVYHPDSNTFTPLADSLFANEPDWAISSSADAADVYRLKDNRSVILAYRGSPATYALMTFAPATKAFQKVTTTPALPDSSVASLWVPIVDQAKNLVYMLSLDPAQPSVFSLYRVDLATGKLDSQLVGAIPNMPSPYAMGMTVLGDGRILLTGGTTSDNFSAHPHTAFITPNFTEAGPKLGIARYTGVAVEGTVGKNIRIDYATAVQQTNWTTLTNFSLPSSPFLYFDISSTNDSSRLYRAVQTE
jgi:hypothetical protein